MRFRELRRMGNREQVTELEVTEWDPPHSVRMVADSHGTVWDTLFTISPVEGGTMLKLDMDARAGADTKWMPPAMRGCSVKRRAAREIRARPARLLGWALELAVRIRGLRRSCSRCRGA